jgi:hypothetical protein
MGLISCLGLVHWTLSGSMRPTLGATSSAVFTTSLSESFGWNNVGQWRLSTIPLDTKPTSRSNLQVGIRKIFTELKVT